MELLLNILFIILSLLAAAAVGLMIFFKLTISIRDSCRRPAEKRLGQGARKALFLYQPSNAKRNVPQAEALAARLAEMGYAVTVNHPSEDLPYAPGDYDLLVFGTPVYMGETARPLRRYLETHPFTGKRVLLYVDGLDLERAPELETLKGLVPAGNELYTVKVEPRDREKLLTFATEYGA